MKPLLFLLVLSATPHNSLAEEPKPFGQPFKMVLNRWTAPPILDGSSFNLLGTLTFEKGARIELGATQKPKEIKKLPGADSQKK